MGRKRPEARFVVKNAHADVHGDHVSREIVLVALEADGELGPELHMTALDASTYAYFERRLGETISLGVTRARRRAK